MISLRSSAAELGLAELVNRQATALRKFFAQQLFLDFLREARTGDEFLQQPGWNLTAEFQRSCQREMLGS